MTCHVTNQLNAYLDGQDADDALAEYRAGIERQLVERAEKRVIMCLNLNHMNQLAALCDEHNNNLASITAMLIKEEQELVMDCMIYHDFSEGEAETIAKMIVHYFDFESAIDAEIERRDMAAGEPNE